MIYSKAIVIFLLSIVVIASSWLIIVNTHFDDGYSVGTRNNSPDTFVERALITQMDKDGKLYVQFRTPYLTHYPVDDSTRFEQPEFVFFTVDQKPWYLNSEHGFAVTNFDTIVLSKNVNLHQPPGRHNLAHTMRTTVLNVYPKRKFAETHAPVTITDPNTLVYATGLRVYFDEKRLELLSQVRGQYHEKK